MILEPTWTISLNDYYSRVWDKVYNNHANDDERKDGGWFWEGVNGKL